MNSIDMEDKYQKIIKYGKYILLIFVAFLIFLISNGCVRDYQDIEFDMIDEAKKYISDNNVNVLGEYYIEISFLEEIEGTELCSKASGVIVSNKSGKLEYTAYLKCNDYESNIVNNSEKYITLNKGNVIVLNKGEVYEEPNYIVNREILDGDISVNGKVLTTPGIYTITYDIYVDYTFKESVIRKVIVVNNKDLTVSGLLNKEYPILTLKGEKKMTLSLNEKYNEPGYTAVDYTDGKISRNVVKNEINTKELGNYTITYSITNSKGNTTLAVRQISVVKKRANLTINLKASESISKEVVVNYNVEGDGFDKIILPNGENGFRNGQYKVNANAIYTFKIYDIYNNEYIKEIDISSIDNILPTGTCNAITTTSKTVVNVEATDNKGIAGYSYILDGVASPYQENKVFETNSKIKKVAINVKDVAGNVSALTCKVEEGNEEYVNEKGYNCLQPFSCFKQGDYGSSQYTYCSKENVCGTIAERGCSITSVTTLISGFGARTPSGELYTPYTLLTDVYKKFCSSSCSGTTATKKVFNYFGINVIPNPETGDSFYVLNKATAEVLKEHLRKGGAAILRVGKGWYTTGGHLMAILGINDEGLVYLYDPGTKIGTGSHNRVNTFVSTDDIIEGNGSYFQLISK